MQISDMWDKFSKEQQISHLEKGLPAPDSAGIFGMSLKETESELVILPVPWEATASYGSGSSRTPSQIIFPSHQLDLFDLSFGEPYKRGITIAADMEELAILNHQANKLVSKVRERSGSFETDSQFINQVNDLSNKINRAVYMKSAALLRDGRKVAVLGGDHSSPYGLIKAINEFYEDVGIVHIDAHFDYREKYEGFNHSHASIMYNVMNDFKNINKIYHIGVRDFSKDEYDFFCRLSADARSLVDYSSDVYKKLLEPNGLNQLFDRMCDFLPNNIYVSFDVDGLDPKLCPGTGTPVPGGLDFEFICLLLEHLSKAGKRILGFDLCEVASSGTHDWDYNVGSRILYKLCGLTLNQRDCLP